MRKQRRRKTEETIELRLWTYAESQNARPYLRSIVRSLREHWLEMQRVRVQVERLDARPGRPDRRALIARAEAVQEADGAEQRLEEALRELMALHVYCLDPLNGLALIPFSRGGDLAWFVFDLFAPDGVEAWRFHADPLETRRPLVDVEDPRVVAPAGNEVKSAA